MTFHLLGGSCFLLSAFVLTAVGHRYKAFELTEVATWILGPVFISIGTLWETDDFVRRRTVLLTYCLTLLPPIFLCMRLMFYIPLACMVMVFHMFFVKWVESEHGYTVEMKTTLTYFFFTCAFTFAAANQTSLLRALKQSEVLLSQQKQASLCLVSMLCDAWCILSDDGDTIVQTDGRFDGMVGHGLVGSTLSVHMENIEQWMILQQRLRGMVDSSRECEDMDSTAKQLAMPLTLRALSGSTVRVTLFIVSQKSGKDDGAVNFLVGICQALEEERQDALAPMAPLELEPGGGPKPAEALSEVPSSIGTADCFTVDCEDILSALRQIRELGLREHWVIEQEDLHLYPGGIIGMGSYGAVLSGAVCGAAVVAKVVHSANSGQGSGILSAVKSLCNELRCLRHCRHPNLVQLQGAVCDFSQLQLAIVLEHVAGGDLEVWMSGADRPQAERYRIVVGASRGLWYLHSRQPSIAHGDLKDKNLLVAYEGRLVHAKLADFGLSRLHTGERDVSFGGTLRWIAPEVVRREASGTPSSDMFSFGRLLQFVATGLKPSLGLTPAEIQKLLKANIVTPAVWPEPPTMLQEHLRTLSEVCCSSTPGQRPSAQAAHELLCGVPTKDFDDDLLTAAQLVRQMEGLMPWVAAFNDTSHDGLRRAAADGRHPDTKLKVAL